MKIRFSWKRFLKTCLRVFLITVGSILMVIFLRVFCFASFKIPSGSMEPTLTSGDFIMVNKMIPGPRIFDDWKFWWSRNFDMHRMNGFRALKRNEIVVFNLPISNNDEHTIKMDFDVHFVKRCVGLPGDTFYIDNGIYKVKGCKDTLGCFPNQLELSHFPDSTMRMKFDSTHHWTMKHFGPIYIPKKNDVLAINVENVERYKKLIAYETRKPICLKNGHVYLANKVLKSYRFKMNYYFMAGDFIFDSYDSRYWGLLPEDHIIAKVSFIWKSQNAISGKYRWKRFFKDPNSSHH